MNPGVIKTGVWKLFRVDTPGGLYNALTGGLYRGTGKGLQDRSMPYGVIDLSGFQRSDYMGTLDSSQFQEGIVQLTFWSKTTSDTEIDNIQGLASALYDYCGTDDQDTITISGWTVTQFAPGLVLTDVDPNNPEKYMLVMDFNLMLQKND